MRTFYVSKIRNLLTDPVIEDQKIGNKDDLISYIANQFNIDKNIINFEFGELKKMEDIYAVMENDEWNINDVANLYNENIIIKIDDATQLHIHRYTPSRAFQVWIEEINAEHRMQEVCNDLDIFSWKDEE